jgi:hypothetical protein
MLHLADELNAPFSKYPYQWDALAVSFSSLMVATLAQIEGGPPFFLVTLTYLKRLGWATTNHNHKFEKNS